MKKIIAMMCAAISLTPLSAQERPYKCYLVSTAHFDNQWNWDVRQSIDEYIPNTMTQNFWLFERFPDYVFNFESAQKYAWMKEYYPALYSRVKEYVKSGRWNVVGSCWEANDPNMPSAESFFRNILQGQEFYKREFGVKCNDIYLPDCFGFSYTMPTVAAHCGLKGFSTQKLQWRKNVFYGEAPDSVRNEKNMWRIDNKWKIPFPIGVWQGLDGSSVIGALDTGGYGTSFFYDDITTNKRIIDRAAKDPNKTAFAYYGVGDRGGSPTLPSVYSMEQSLKGTGPVKVLSARAGDLYEDLWPIEKHPELPVFRGELNMDVHGVGCYTSQAAMKLFNRRNEHLADAAERASVVAELLGGIEYPADALRENWQRLLWHQFHDDITGTSIPRTYTFSWNDHCIVQSRFADAVTNAVGAVARCLDTRADGTSLVVYNAMSVQRRDIVKATIPMAKKPQGVKVSGPKGAVPAQLIAWKDGKAEIIFAADVAPMSFSVYGVKAADAARSTLKVSEKSLENNIYKLELNGNGDIKSIIDKRYGKQLVADGRSFGLALLTDNVSKEYPAWELFKKTIDGPVSPVTENVKMSVYERGPLRATIKVERDWKDSHFVQYISLTNGGADDRIEVANEVYWAGKNVLLKAEFPTTLSSEKAAYDLGIGYVRRGVNSTSTFEVLGHQWADLSDEDSNYGVSIINDSKYGWDKPDKNTIRLTLLNTPGCEGSFYHYQGHQDHGHHTFTYAIVGHKGGIEGNGIADKAESMNQPLVAFTTPRHGGKLGKNYSFASIDNAAVSIMAVKKAEDGDGYILRVNEMEGNDYTDATITFAQNIESAVETNGIEEQTGNANFSGNKLTFSGKSFQPRTFRLRFAERKVTDIPASTPVALDYNAVALTPDEFARTGNFDKQGNSLAAELMPAKLTSDGITFNINNDPAVKDFIRANGDTISLPEHHGADKLFMLVTSVNGDRKTTFRVDDKEYETLVPYYSGFIGQWGWKGENEGWLKDAHLAYVANHKHSAAKGNDSYNFAYLYKVCLDITPDARQLILPKDAGIAVFAVTLTDNRNYNTKAATEMRIIPQTTKELDIATEPMPYFNERSAW